MRKGDASPMHPDGTGWRLALAADHAPPLRSPLQENGAALPCSSRDPLARVPHARRRRGHAGGPAHPRWVHGMRSKAAVDIRRLVNELVRETRETRKTQ